MAWKGFKWIRIVLAVLGIVVKETKTKKDDKIVDVATDIENVVEGVASSKDPANDM